MKTKHLLIGLGVVAVGVGAYFGIKYYNNKKKKQEEDEKKQAELKAKSVMGTATEEQFNRFMTNAFRTGNSNEELSGRKKNDYLAAKPLFLKNLSYNDGDRIALIASMEMNNLPETQIPIFLDIIKRWFKN